MNSSLTELPEGIIRTPEGIYVLESDSHLSVWLREHKRLDIAEPQIAHYAKYIPVGGTVIDAGASLGDHVCTYAKLVGPTGRVLALEPHPLTFQALKLNFDRWSSVVCVNRALSDGAGVIGFNPETNIGASFCGWPGTAGTVECVALDSYLESFMSCDLIHLDCEGFEARALLGARAVLARFHPTIVLEINHGCLARYGLTERDVLATLDELGYHWQEIESGHGPHLPQRDILALPR